jgi:hypothetical protein
MKRIINSGRKPTPIGGDGIPPHLDVNHPSFVSVTKVLRAARIDYRVRFCVYRSGCNDGLDFQTHRIEFLEEADLDYIEEVLRRNPGAWRSGGSLSELHYAACIGDAEMVSRLIAIGHDVNEVEPRCGYSAVHWLIDMSANGGDRLQALVALHDAGADLECKSLDGSTPLAVGEAVRADPDLLRLLRSLIRRS